MDMPAFQDIKYERPSLEAFRENVMRVRLKIMTAHSTENIETALLEFQKEYSRFKTAMSLCMIHHDRDIGNAFFQEEMTFFEEAYAVAEELAAGVYSALLNSEFKEDCIALFEDMIFKKAQNKKDIVSKELIAPLSREAALQNEYDRLIAEAVISFDGKEYNISTITPFLESANRSVRKMAEKAVADFYSDCKEKMDQIYDELVLLRTDMAKKQGFDNFIGLGYKRMERYDYTPEMVAEFRDMVVKYIVPITIEIRKLQKERFGHEALKYYDLKSFFVSGNPIPALSRKAFSDAASRLFQEIFESDPSFYDVLQLHGFTDIDARKGKAAGGYCTTLLDYGIPFVFLNANEIAEDITTLIHEAGHAYAAIRSVDASPFLECMSPTLEACEIHSTAMEFLSYPYMDLFFGKNADAYRELHMTQALLFLPYGCMVDEFQHMIYENPDLSPDERHGVWKRLEEKYQPFLDYDGIPFYENGGAWQKKGHIFTDPFYYIDYCLALVVSLEIWDMSEKDYKKALSRYDQFCMEGGTAAFLTLLEKARLSNPFHESAMKRVAYQACRFLQL